MPKYILITIVLLMLASMHAGAGNSGQTTIRAAMGTSPRAADNQKVMIQAAVVPAKSAADTKPIAPPPPALRAADWIAAWQAAREACPEASGMTIYYNDRSGPTLESIKVFECVDMKARGELLVITIKQPGQKEESVAIVRASDVVRIDVRKPSAPSSP